MNRKINKKIMIILICALVSSMSACGSDDKKETISSTDSTKVDSTINKEVSNNQDNKEPQKPSDANKNSNTTKNNTKDKKNNFSEYDKILNIVLAFNLGEFKNPSEIDKSELLFFACSELLSTEPNKYDPVDKNAGTYSIPEKDVQNVIYKYFGIKDFSCNDKSYNSSKKSYVVVNNGIGCTITWETLEEKIENELIILRVKETNDATNLEKTINVTFKKNGSDFNLISVKYVN